MKILTTILLFLGLSLFPTNVWSQTDCADWYVKKLKKKIRKASCGQKGHLNYELAQCYKNSNDSAYKLIINDALTQFKGCYDNPLRTEKIKRLFLCADISFELNDFNAADTYFDKAFASLNPDCEIKARYLLHYGQVKLYFKKYDQALKAFEAYKIVLPFDNSADIYIDKCKTEKKDR